MIRINLYKGVALGSASRNFDDEGAQVLTTSELRKQVFIRIFIILLGPIGLYIYEAQNIPEKVAILSKKNQHLTEVQQKNAKAKTAVEEIKKFKQDEEKLQQQIGTIDNLSRDRLKVVKILDQMQRDIPEKLWLSQLTIQDGAVQMAGTTAVDEDMTVFLDKLSSSVFFQDVKLRKSNQEQFEGSLVTKFNIDCTLQQPKKNDLQGTGANK